MQDDKCTNERDEHCPQLYIGVVCYPTLRWLTGLCTTGGARDSNPGGCWCCLTARICDVQEFMTRIWHLHPIQSSKSSDMTSYAAEDGVTVGMFDKPARCSADADMLPSADKPEQYRNNGKHYQVEGSRNCLRQPSRPLSLVISTSVLSLLAVDHETSIEDIRRSVAHWPPRWSTIAIGAKIREKERSPSIISPLKSKEREPLACLPPPILPGSPLRRGWATTDKDAVHCRTMYSVIDWQHPTPPSGQQSVEQKPDKWPSTTTKSTITNTSTINLPPKDTTSSVLEQSNQLGPTTRGRQTDTQTDRRTLDLFRLHPLFHRELDGSPAVPSCCPASLRFLLRLAETESKRSSVSFRFVAGWLAARSPAVPPPPPPSITTNNGDDDDSNRSKEKQDKQTPLKASVLFPFSSFSPLDPHSIFPPPLCLRLLEPDLPQSLCIPKTKLCLPCK
ncbi:hypothetical protein MGYG_00318 [Nannizzia gypsea CBS 118893]|uniref:Uncharacterized protein n=1 Tax=Arthroderma gypseum (strain ATCC MYA-4604 / CBS 118893) TaxID=535722 RepID=E5QYT9_ARTGP|nr:hypothetical protein MGYG_00318 [Nannizzia gypsea CBS 118893]EFQ97277.1 hypothetical protein MGYG_00318 [Nannizzia gypsea CBS 118893]